MEKSWIHHSLFVIAQQDEGPPWWLFPLFAIVGLVMIGIGSYGIVHRKAIISRRQMRALRLFGIEEATGKWAVIIGGGQCFAGCLALMIALVGPFIAGTLKDDKNPPAARGQAGGPQPQAANPLKPVPNSQAGPVLVAGHPRGEQFADVAPAGGLLVGLRVTKGTNYGGALHAIQPVYQVGNRYAFGQRHGKVGGEEHQLLAKPGYAVGAIHARAGLVLNALQLVFYKVDGLHLDPGDRYESEWVGCDGGAPFHIDVQGAPITGLNGTLDEDIVSLGIAPSQRLDAPIPLVTDPPPDLWSEPRPGAVLGLALGTAVTDMAPDGGVLVGVRAFCDPGRARTLRSFQPIYIHKNQYVEGRRLGEGGTIEVLAVARPGFIVTGIEFKGDHVSGMRLTFTKVVPEVESEEDSYESLWLGYTFDRVEQKSTTEGRAAVGFIVYSDGVLRGVGLMQIGSKFARLDAAPDLPHQYRNAAYARPPLRAGSEEGNPFTDEVPNGGLLVGLRCSTGTNWGGALQAVQPIYQIGNKYVLGQRHGTAGGREQELLAKPGYAVGAMHARAGIVVNALQLVFYRIDAERLDPQDRYESSWVGSKGGDSFDLDAQGCPVTGVFGTWVQDLISIGLAPTQRLWSPLPLADGSRPIPGSSGVESSDHPYRRWKSADGKSNVEARLLGIENDSVQLERRDGKKITVPLSKLSPGDIRYVRRQQ